MKPRDPRTSLSQMLEHASEAAAMLSGRSRDDLQSDRQLGLAITRLLEIVGEAATRVTPEQRLLYPDMAWKEIIALRNRLIHGYDAVDYDILWVILTQDLPVLIDQLQRILAKP